MRQIEIQTASGSVALTDGVSIHAGAACSGNTTATRRTRYAQNRAHY